MISDLDVVFRLDDNFIERYIDYTPNWGPVGYITYKRTYARPIETNRRRYKELAKKFNLTSKTEEWWLTCARVVEGTYTIQKRHCYHSQLPWDDDKAQRSAQEMYDLMINFKFLPPGRGLWMMGTDYIYKNGGAALNNCSFISTENIDENFSEPFTFMMDMLMLGVGVGGDTRGAGKIELQYPKGAHPDDIHTIDDSREGWVEALEIVLKSFVGEAELPKFDYSKIREKGEQIKGFGGTASGPEPLKELLEFTEDTLIEYVQKPIDSKAIVDIFNYIGKCVVAGNVRRSAEIIFGGTDDETFRHLKDPKINSERMMSHGWASNNSVFAEVGMDYTVNAECTAKNGEPGYEWLDNARKYGRMIDPPDYKDMNAMGGNPCLEQTLFSKELCTLVETFPFLHDSFHEYKRTLKFAYLYAKTVTLIPTHNLDTNRVMGKNRRIGTSMSGIVQAMRKLGKGEFFKWCDDGYKFLNRLDDEYSDWLCIPKSIKKTSVKPSGTVSLLAGATPGIHFPISEYYYRVIRFASDSPLVNKLENAGYDCYEIDEPNTTAVYFPVKEKYFEKGEGEVSMWEQIENVAQMQAYWADNQVSVTVKFNKEEAKDIKSILELYDRRLKGVSFLPHVDHGFKHPPYQPITKEEYERKVNEISELDVLDEVENEQIEKFCDGDTCQI